MSHSSLTRVIALVGVGLATSIVFPGYSNAAVGRTEANYSVTQNGAAAYSIPIRVTDGINGMTPRLALSYAGPGSRTILGVGFALAGFSYITPCRKTIAQDLNAAPVTLTSADRYCLDGARLRLVTGTPYGASETTYRTELDQMVRVTAKASTNNIPGWFKVEMPDGMEYEYGNSPDSKLLASSASGAPPQFWAVNRISDPNGNSIAFVYETDSSTRKFRPNYISYTERAGSGSYRVTFVYQAATQPEPIVVFTPSLTGGAASTEDKLLERIDLSHEGTVYRKIVLAYENGAGNNKRLSSVQECVPGAPDDCLPPTTLAWQSATPGHGPPITGTVASTGVALDINGDGFSDLVWAASGTWRYMLGSTTGYGPVTNTTVTATNPAKAMPLEWNGDGLQDLLIDWSDGKWRVLRGATTGFVTSVVHAGPGTGIPSGSASHSWTVADVNSDGRDDLLKMTLSAALAIYVRTNGSTGFGSESLYYSQTLMRTLSKGFVPIDGASATHRPDFNGDGRTDLLIYACEWEPEPPGFCYATGWYQLISNGTSFTNSGGLPGATLMVDPRFGDFNADGLTDAVYPAQSPGKWYLGFGQGSGGLSIKVGPSFAGYLNYKILTGDHNGDGYDDLYAATSSSQVWDVFHGSSNGLAAAISTGVSSTGYWKLTDVTGDGLTDLGRTDSTTLVWSIYPHAGVPGEHLASAVDGFGNIVSYNYLPMTNPVVYTKGLAALYPERDYKGSAPLVQTMHVSPAGGSAFFLTYKYAGARVHAQGRAFLGMYSREITDSRGGPFVSESYRQDFPFIGALATNTIKQSASGNIIQSATHAYSSHTLSSTAGNERYLPFRWQSVTSAFEVGGIKNGLPITEVTETRTVSTFGNSTFIAIDVNDVDSASPEFGTVYRTEITTAFTQNEPDWCISTPTSRSEKRILQFGVSETRSTAWQVATAQCRITQETIEPGAGTALSLVTDIGYDSCGNVNSASSYPAGTSGQQRTTTINHGTRCQRPESITNPESHTSTRVYDWPLALPSSLTDPNGVVTTLEYDGFGRLKQRNNPDGTDAVFSLTACTGSNGWCGKDGTVRLKVSQTMRDGSNATIRIDEQFQDGFGRARWVHSDSLESGPAMVQTVYDAFGRPSAQSQPYFAGGAIYSTAYTRDLIGRVTQVNAPISESQTSGRITGFSYEGRELKVTDPKGNTTTRRSNVIGQLSAVIDPSPGGTTTYVYRPFGALSWIADAAGNFTSWNYNLRGFVTDTFDPDSGAWVYESNAFGEVERIRDAKTWFPSWTAQFTFDKLSRPLTRSEAEGTTTWSWGTSAASKNIGRLASITSPGSYAEYFTYDSLGRPIQQQVNADSTSYYLNLTYSSATGLLNTLEYPTSTAGYRLKLAYDYANGLLKRVKHATDATVYWEAVSTDAWGHVQDENFGNGVQTFTDFDQASGLMQSREGMKGATQLIHSQVNWDLNGNLTRRKDLKLSPNVTEDFYYDALNRFDYSERTVGAGSPATNADVTLDAIGNLLWKQGVGNYGYHATQKRAVISAGSFTFGYDANGNMTSRNGANIGYTSYNLPSVINAPGGYSSTLSYGAFRNRFKQVAIGPQGTETTIYVAGLLEKVTNGSGTHYRHYIHGGAGTAAIYSRTVGGSTATFYLHRDHLGSPELITDSAGNVLVRPSFAAYGERRDGSDWEGAISSADQTALAGISRRGFTGHEHLDAVGLIHMNGRVYEPLAGRFLSADPLARIGLAVPAGQYAYAGNNPLRFIDPTGFCDVDPVTGNLVNCDDLGPVDVTGERERPEECGWGGPWMAGWGEFCRDWDPYWDHDPFEDFDDQPEDVGNGGSGDSEPNQVSEPDAQHDRRSRDQPRGFCAAPPVSLGASAEAQLGVGIIGFTLSIDIGFNTHGQIYVQLSGGAGFGLGLGLAGGLGANASYGNRLEPGFGTDSGATAFGGLVHGGGLVVSGQASDHGGIGASVPSGRASVSIGEYAGAFVGQYGSALSASAGFCAN